MNKIFEIFLDNLIHSSGDLPNSKAQQKHLPNDLSTLQDTQPKNIVALMSEYQSISGICEDFIDYLSTQRINIENHIQAGECDKETIFTLNEKLIRINNAISALIKKTKFLDTKLSQILYKRTFIPIFPVQLQEFLNPVFQMTTGLYFLDNEYAEAYKYEKLYSLNLNVNEFECFSLLHQASTCTDDLIEFTRRFLQLNKESKLVICCRDVREGGFIICPHSLDQAAHKRLREISEKHPESIQYSELNQAWHFEEGHNDILLIDNFISYYDIWIEVDRCIIYAKDSVFPIRPNANTYINAHYNEDISTGLLFYRTDTPRCFSYSTIIEALENNNKFINPQQLTIYDGSMFNEFDFENGITHSEYILINYLNGHSDKRAAVFCSKNGELVTSFSTTDYDYQLILKMINYNLKMLFISGYQKR